MTARQQELSSLNARHRELGSLAARQQELSSVAARQQELASLTARHQEMLDEDPARQEAHRDLHQRLLHLLQRHGVQDARAAALAAAVSGPVAAGAAPSATPAAGVGASAADDSGLGGNMSATQLEELREEIGAAADLADSILLDLPQQQGTRAAGAAADALGGGGAASAAARSDSVDVAGGGLQAGSVVTNGDFVVAVGSPAPLAEQRAVQGRPRPLRLVIRVLSGMLSWAFRRVRNLLQLQ
jgi:hypothetical protein